MTRQVSKTSAQEIFEALSVRITQLVIPMGERLTEEALSKGFGVSRTPVREALRLLEQAGYVEKSPSSRGYTVRAVTLERADQIYTVRIALEVLSVELAADAVDSEEFAGLKRDVSSWIESAQSDDGSRSNKPSLQDVQPREGFHERLAGLSGNEELLRILREINNQIFAFRRLDSAIPDRAFEAQLEHLRILDVLEARDVDAAREAMRAHIEKSQSTVKSLLRAGVTTIAFGAGEGGTGSELSP
jgi:DNA-binding GntR family transcriptional regulator